MGQIWLKGRLWPSWTFRLRPLNPKVNYIKTSKKTSYEVHITYTLLTLFLTTYSCSGGSTDVTSTQLPRERDRRGEQTLSLPLTSSLFKLYNENSLLSQTDPVSRRKTSKKGCLWGETIGPISSSGSKWLGLNWNVVLTPYFNMSV